MAKRVYKRYFTKEKKEKVNQKSVKAYDRYLRSNIIKDKSVEESTYKVYKNYFYQFLVFLDEQYDNVFIHDEEFMENAVDIMEDFIIFCQDTLGNNKKVINTKLSAVSTYFHWAVKRGNVEYHPFDKRVDRMKGAKEEKLIGHHYLDNDQIEKITEVLNSEYKKEKGKYDLQDALIWGIGIDSANRLGAIHKLTWSNLNLEEMMFEDVREKRGKMVEVPFTHETKKLLLEWKEKRAEIDNLECDAIFIVKHDGGYKAMSKTSIYKRVKKIGLIIGLEDFRPHSIRKTSINKVVEETGDLNLAKELANHEDISTTSNFYTKPKSKAEIREKINNLRKKRETE